MSMRKRRIGMVQAERRPAGHPVGRWEGAAAHRPRPPPVRPPAPAPLGPAAARY